MPQCIHGHTRRLTIGTNTPETSNVAANKREGPRPVLSAGKERFRNWGAAMLKRGRFSVIERQVHLLPDRQVGQLPETHAGWFSKKAV